MPERYATEELNVKTTSKRHPWPVVWYYNKPPPAVFVISLHLAQHIKTPPKGPFVAQAVGRTEGAWSVVDLGEKGWYSPSVIPHHKPAPWTGDISCYLHQPLGYEHGLRRAFSALKACGRITATEYAAAVAWLDEERRLYNRDSEIRDAKKVLLSNGYTVTPKKAKRVIYEDPDDSALYEVVAEGSDIDDVLVDRVTLRRISPGSKQGRLYVIKRSDLDKEKLGVRDYRRLPDDEVAQRFPPEKNVKLKKVDE